MKFNQRTWRLALIISWGAAGLFGCGAKVDQAEQRAITARLPKRPGWTVRKDPVVETGDFLAKGVWGDPSVLKVNGQYVMYMTTSTKEPFEPPILPFRAVSPDGIKWQLQPMEPLLQPPSSEFASAETPAVILFKGKYHMYYTAIKKGGGPQGMAIGHAESDDGITWKNDPEPLLRCTTVLSDWNGYLVAEPGVIEYEGKIHLYYCAMGARPGGNPPQLQTVGLAISEDGRRFGPQRSVFGQTDLYPPTSGFVGYSTPCALAHNGRIHVFYNVSHFQKGRNPEWQQIALHHAVSGDGGKTFVQDSGPIMTRDQLDWTSGEMLAPWVIVDGNQVKMWFGGHVQIPELAPMILRGFKGREFGVGYATADLSWLDQP